MSFFADVFQKGGPVMWPLLGCSVLALTMVIERAIFWWRLSRLENDEFIERMLSLAERREYSRAVAECEASEDPAARMISAGLAHREYCLSEAMAARSAVEVEKMKRGMAVLDTIITMSPLLGILGTVTGIIKSFNLLGERGMDDPRAATAGLAEALITTAAGLVVALLTLLPHNYFVARIQSSAQRLERIGSELEVVYARSRDRKDGSGADASCDGI